jgi:mono/diheme cytochrome c family protein
MHRVALLALLALSCKKQVAPSPAASAAAPTKGVCDVASALVPLSTGGSSSSIALGRLGKQRVLFLADEDDRALRVVDLDRRVVTATIALGSAPGHVLIARGRVHVSLPEDDAVIELAPDGTECGRVSTPEEPIALAHDGQTLFVASRRGHSFTSVRDGKTASLALSRDPTAILLEGRTAIVSHRTGSIVSVVSLEQNVVAKEISFAWRDRVAFLGRPVADMPRFAVQAHALARVGHRVMVPMVLAYPGDTHLEVTFNSGYGAPSVRGVDGYFPHEAAIASFEPNGTVSEIRLDHEIIFETKQRLSHGRRMPEKPPCLLPRSVASEGEDLVVACLGINQLIVHRGELDLAHSERLRVAVPGGPTAVAIDRETREAVVWSQFAREISLVDIDVGSRLPFAIEAAQPLDPALAEGRKTFHAPLGFDGRACASCHPDGRDDGLVWSSPHGPLQAPVLAGRLADTQPYGWLAGGATLHDHITETMKRIGGVPMHKGTMDSLVSYLGALKPRAPRALNAIEKRGRTLFASAEVGCATCHQNGGSDGLRHDVGTGGTFDTPSLAAVGTSAPYMHDGRFATLRQAIAGNAMGSTKHLGEDDLAALVAYLKTL